MIYTSIYSFKTKSFRCEAFDYLIFWSAELICKVSIIVYCIVTLGQQSDYSP